MCVRACVHVRCLSEVAVVVPFRRGHSHAGGSRAGSGNGTRSEHSLEEGGHRGGPSSRKRFRVLQLCFIVPGKGCLRALDMWRKPLVFVSRPGAGSSLSPRNASNGCIPHRLGSGHEWPPCPRSTRPERSPRVLRYLVYRA